MPDEPRRRSATVVDTACPLDCPDACSLSISVEEGRVVKVDAGPASPTTNGFICGKVRRFTDHLYGEHRLLHPEIRAGAKGSGKFRRATWDEAMELIASRMREASEQFGGESILPYSYGGSNGLITHLSTDADLWGPWVPRGSRARCAPRRPERQRRRCTARCPELRTRTTPPHG